MYNCRDEHIASVSRKGDILLHNLASGTKAAEFRDPNGQVLGSLDYSRTSRHLLVTAGDDGSIHLWDTTGRSPKISWLKQHSAPISGVSFSPSNDKIIASVGLDKKLYTFDSGSRKPTSCIPYEAPFSSLAFTGDGLTLAAGTSTGQIVFYDVRGKLQPINVLRAYGNSEAITNLCWQRSKAVAVNETTCTDDTVLLAGDVGDSTLVHDPIHSRTSSSGETTSSALNLEERAPIRLSGLTGGTLTRLNAPRSYNFKDDMEVFSPLVEVQPITPSLDKFWNNQDGSKKDTGKKASYMFPWFGSSGEGVNDNRPISDQRSASKPEESQSTLSESLGVEKLLPKSTTIPSRFPLISASGSSSGSNQSTSSLITGPSPAHLPVRENSIVDPSLSLSRRFSSYAERIGAIDPSSSPLGSPKLKKTGAETRKELLNSLLSRSEMLSASGTDDLTTTNVGAAQSEETPIQSGSHQGNSFTLQLFQRSLEETLAWFQESIHDDIINVHIDLLRQFHIQEMEMSNAMSSILENQAELMKEIQLLRRENQELKRLL